jgi:O-antigen/teichoic acid export membrane protein
MTQLNPKVESPKGLANVAAFGAAWTIAQAVLNKAATLVAMYVIALQLSPDEFGMAALTLSIGNFLVVLPPLTMSDLMIAEQIGVSERVRLGQRLAIRVGVITTIGIIALSPAVASLYSKYPFAMLAGLIMAFSVRPSIEGMAVAPLSQLRVESRFGVIALIDGSAQLVATVIMVALAFMGTGAISLIVPQVIAIAVRAICYRIAVRRTTVNSPDDGARSNGAINGLSFRHLLTLGSAQYVHNILYSLPVLVLGYFSSEAETGLYAFAFQFASQANGIVSCQLGVVLQPIFGKLKGDLVRQTSGFLRSIKAISAIVVPVTLLQAALAQPLFALVFKPEWQPACKIFIMLSLVEAISFVVAPTLALLKSQQKFRVFFLWQVIQCAVSLVAFSFAAHYMGGVGVAVAGAILWATSLSFAVWFGIHKVGGTLWSAIKVLLVPWTTALPFAGVAWLASHFLTPFGNWGMGISIFIVGPIVLILSVLATRISQPETYAEFAPIIFRFLSLPLKSLKAKSLSGNAAE